MIKKINYVANDGKEFDTAAECLEYEKMMLNNFKRAMVELDVKLWERYYPEQKGQPNPELYQAVDWLRADIEHIMLDFPGSREDILNLIRTNKYGKEILKEIALNKIDRNVEIRSDFAAALKSVKSGSDLSSDLRWNLSNKDICKLAKLHQKNKYRKKIESLLTDCNFHYECGKFINGEYDEFIQ